MKQIRFFFALILTGCLFYYLNFKQGDIPALGKFMNPFTGFWQNGETEALDIPSQIKSNKLSAPVTIKYDDMYVPHIFAENDYDLYFAQGYTLAYHRLWQMDFQVLATEGRISEIIGEKALEFDRTQRRKGLKYGAKRAIEKLKSDTVIMNVLRAYSAGVNHRIAEIGYADLPIEYKLLDYKPEKWSPYRTMLLLKYMADMLSSGEADLENTNALKLFGKAEFDILFPESFKSIDPIIPSERNWDFEPVTIERPEIKFPLDLIENTIDKPDPRNGSNNFAIGPDKTVDGSVLLANEPDLSLNLPSLWYVNQLATPDMNVFGATLPGAPGVIIGFNDSIAWGLTNAKRDVVDWYKISFRNEKRKEYKYDDKWLKTEKVVEQFKVRDGKDLIDTIVFTHYGPVTYDYNFLGKKELSGYAMKWAAHEECEELKTLYLMNRAKNYDDYNEAAKFFRVPAQNMVFGSAQGEIAMRVAGKFAIKWPEQGKFLMDGADSRLEWNQDIPHEHGAFVRNPEIGFVSSANQHPVDSTYPYYVYDHNYEFYRNRRINDRLRYLEKVSVNDMMKLQNDNFNYRASESLPLMLDSLDTASFDQAKIKAYDQLKKWDFFNEPEWVAPSIYEAWWNLLYASIWDELDREDVALIKPHIFNTIYLMKNDSASRFYDRLDTDEVETLTQLINDSFDQALKDLDSWKEENGADYQWYKYKNTTARHLLRLAPFSVDNIKVGGNNNIVNAASSTHGPSWRMVVQLTKDGAKGWGVYPGSQSGNPGNPDYASMVDNWANGKYYPLVFLKSVDEANEQLIFTQTIKN